MKSRISLNQTRSRRDARVRAKILGTADMPRLTVFRSNASFYAQLIDDVKGHTLASVSMKELASDKATKGKANRAEKLGMKLAEKAMAMKIARAKFDRGQYPYHGRVKAFAEGARKGGLVI